MWRAGSSYTSTNSDHWNDDIPVQSHCDCGDNRACRLVFGLFLFFFQEYLWAVWLSCRGTALLWRLWSHLFYANKLASAATIAACQMWVQNWAVWSQCHWSVSAHCRRCTLSHLLPTDPPSGRMLQGNSSDTMNSTADSLGGILLLCPCT